PKAILKASSQVDLMHATYPELWQLGLFLLPIDKKIKKQSKAYKKEAQAIIKALEKGQIISANENLSASLYEVNKACAEMVKTVEKTSLKIISQNKLPVVLGGDHSTPLGYYKALAQQHNSFGILQVDAHMDFRKAYEGFTYSHASIMYNALQLHEVSKIVQVGIRDFCKEEIDVVTQNSNRIQVFSDRSIQAALFSGSAWESMCEEIIAALPDKVCISVDIDGLQPAFCPNTGTPVPGGLTYEQLRFLLEKIAFSNKQVIGFDLVEVAPGKDDEWDANVGARLLFDLCGCLAKSNGLRVGNPVQF
ncbi:MAG: agmatinase family protein, partial [Flavobacteriaceae bacterium]|nr:agmatinase family protein [Flavobacteriaceae bacterium]